MRGFDSHRLYQSCPQEFSRDGEFLASTALKRRRGESKDANSRCLSRAQPCGRSTPMVSRVESATPLAVPLAKHRRGASSSVARAGVYAGSTSLSFGGFGRHRRGVNPSEPCGFARLRVLGRQPISPRDGVRVRVSRRLRLLMWHPPPRPLQRLQPPRTLRAPRTPLARPGLRPRPAHVDRVQLPSGSDPRLERSASHFLVVDSEPRVDGTGAGSCPSAECARTRQARRSSPRP